MDHRRRSYTVSTKRVSRKQNKRGYREFKRNAWTPSLSIAAQGQSNRRDGIPPSMLQKLRYTGVTELVLAGSSYSENGVTITLDPFGILSAGLPTTHQPTYFDQFMTLYTNYRVRAYKVRIQSNCLPQPPSTNTAPGTAWFSSTIVAPQSGPSAPPVTGYLGNAQDARSKSGLCQRADAGITTHKHYHTLIALAGNVDPTDDAYTGSSTASPPLSPLLIMVARSDSGTQAMDVFVQLDIKFYVEFFNPLPITTS